MSLKMSVLFCVLYFYTVARSIGLDKHQIDKLVNLSKHNVKSNGIFPNDAIVAYLLEVGYTDDVNIFEKEFVVNNKTMPEFLVLLADNNKKSDCWTNVGFTTYEVKIFVGIFIVQNKEDGLLDIAELIQLLNNHLYQTEDTRQRIINELKNGIPRNVLFYMAELLKHKQTNFYQHLNEEQIDKSHALYEDSKNYLDYDKQKALFKTFNIIPDKHDYLLDFKHVRSAALELQELLVFRSEYEKNFDKNVPYITSVRQYMWEFNSWYDKNHDGLLDIQELIEESRIRSKNYKNMETYLDKFFPDRSRPMCAAMFLNMQLSLNPEDYRKETLNYMFN